MIINLKFSILSSFCTAVNVCLEDVLAAGNRPKSFLRTPNFDFFRSIEISVQIYVLMLSTWFEHVRQFIHWEYLAFEGKLCAQNIPFSCRCCVVRTPDFLPPKKSVSACLKHMVTAVVAASLRRLKRREGDQKLWARSREDCTACSHYCDTTGGESRGFRPTWYA